MSGVFTARVNRVWNLSQANITAAVVFWDFLKYFESHSGFVFRGYGVGKTQSGTTPPLAWTGWDPLTQAVPWAANAWFVVEAVNADLLLNGAGGAPWQSKFQTTLSTGFDDCNVANVDYGQETQTYCVCIRSSARGGWNATTLDFSPSGGEQVDTNQLLYQGQNLYYNLDITGDDETVVWKGSAYASVGTRSTKSRGGIIGMFQRRSASVTYAFFSAIGRMSDTAWGTGINATHGRYQFGTSQVMVWSTDYDTTYGWLNMPWPNYSIFKDKTKVATHRVDAGDCRYQPNLNTVYKPTSEDILHGIILAQWQASKYAIVGELRGLYSIGTAYAQNTIFGTDPQYQQISEQALTYGGIAMRWPVGVVPAW